MTEDDTPLTRAEMEELCAEVYYYRTGNAAGKALYARRLRQMPMAHLQEHAAIADALLEKMGW